MKTTLAVLAAISVAVSAFGQGTLGTVTFANTLAKPVTDAETQAPVAQGVAIAGLYFTTDLTATPSVNPPLDTWTLAKTTAITPVAAFAGVYSGGATTLEGTVPGTTVLIQVRAWSAAYSSYAEAWANAAATPKVGYSNVMQVSLGGGTIPVPNLSGVVEPFELTLVPEPSTIALGLLGGLGAMLLLRRRK